METIDELTTFLATATVDGILGRLLYRGAAWSLMREEGILPANAPPLGATIETDLAEHGLALLRGAMALRGQAGASDLTNKAFERAANAFEALVRNGDPTSADRGFRRTIAAAAYHLAGFSAVAYSLFNETGNDLNAAPGEVAIRHLILRDLGQLRGFVRGWLDDESHGDLQIAEALLGEDPDTDDAISTILNTTICRALAHFDFALETGEPEPIETARALLATAVSLADNAENVPLWWVSNLCRHLIDDLWQHSLHQNLPTEPPEGTEERYPDLRRLFIASLYARKTSEVELWPSQREAARRSTDVTDDLVVALPTSAGKTRVAEIAALMTLSSARRVLIVTPLRALSAQTERSFRKTFAPLGFSVSSLYGASGLSAGDEDALRSREIIIATPEKLDFALRSDPSLIDDVGLIVLDEGHMIGPSEREIRYETLVQRLLRRGDAGERRIVCLSAILPSGDELDDLTTWIRSDEPGEPVRSDWRPTRQRFGALTWRGKDALLRLDFDENGPFLDKFVVEKPARGKEKIPYPRKNSHLTLFAAWEFASQGKRTLIFSTQANWVEGYGKQVVNLCNRGYLDSLLEDEASIARALEVGKEWLGEDHPAVACLRVGVAIHHGRLPSPFLRELEALLTEGVLKVIVASPTLSQGLNLNAAVLLVPALYRASEKIKGEEFANVAGRAGRAFVDVEGLIVHVMFDKIDWRKKEWRKLVASAKERTLKSGLIQIVAEILERLAREGVLDRDDAWEYLANAREAWRWVSRDEAVARLGTMLSCLEKTSRYHGMFPHFINGRTAETIPFSRKDDGGDVVETAFLFQGLLCARQYFDRAATRERDLCRRIDRLWRGAEWDWFRRDGGAHLFWHWSPRHGWAMNRKIAGWNEGLLAYVLAAGSPDHAIDPEVYHQGFASGPAFRNGRNYHGIELPLGMDHGGPLFIAHYSFCGLDPRGLMDRHADYWQQNVRHTRINYEHCIANPHGYAGYGRDCWGLTSSHGPKGYVAHAPGKDTGVITPSAGLSSFPYAPDEAMRALRYFKTKPRHRIWGRFGFVDAFCESRDWYARTYLAINQGPIVIMIENLRTGLLWNLFMNAPEVQAGLRKLGFTSPHLSQGRDAMAMLPVSR